METVNDSESDSELEDICNVITDSHKKMNSVEMLAHEFFTDGFIKKENMNDYVGYNENMNNNIVDTNLYF